MGLGWPVVVELRHSHPASDEPIAQRSNALGAVDPEADVEPIRERLVSPGRDEGQQEAVVVANEASAVGLERRAELEVLLVEVSACGGVANTQVEVVEIHGGRASRPDPPARASSPRTIPGCIVTSPAHTLGA
jgi:hypothetical protein